MQNQTIDRNHVYRFGQFWLVPRERMLYGDDGSQAKVRGITYALLVHLLENADQELGIETLCMGKWGHGNIRLTEDALKKRFERLYRLLRDDRDHPEYIQRLDNVIRFLKVPTRPREYHPGTARESAAPFKPKANQSLTRADGRRTSDEAERGPGATPFLLDRVALNRVIGDIADRITKTKNQLFISGLDCKILEAEYASVQNALARNVEVKIICADPFKPDGTISAIAEMMPFVDAFYGSAHDFIETSKGVRRQLERLRRQYNNLEYRYLPILPPFGMFLSDPNDHDGIVKIEIYASLPCESLNSRPHLLIPSNLPEWKVFFINQWKLYWSRARDSEGDRFW